MSNGHEPKHTGLHKATWDFIRRLIDWSFENNSFLSLDLLMRGGTAGSLRSGTVGHGFEKFLAQQLRERGMYVLDIAGKRAPYDMLVGNIKVQAKFLGPSNSDIKPRGRDRDGVRGYRQSDFDVLAVAWNSLNELYFVPTSLLSRSDGWLTTTFHPERYQSYKNAWNVFCQRCPIDVDKQMTLFD